MRGSKDPNSPREIGPNRAANVGQKPRPERSIAGHSKLKTSGGSATAKGPGTPSPSLKAAARGVGNGGIAGAPGGSKTASKVVGPKHGKGPGGIGLTGIGAPWG